MTDVRIPQDADMVRLFTGHYQEVVMEATFRSRLLADTGRVVSSRMGQHTRRLLLGSAAVVAVAVALLLVWHFARPSQVVVPRTPAVARAPEQGGVTPPLSPKPSPSPRALAGSPGGGRRTTEAKPAPTLVRTPEPGRDAPQVGPRAPFLAVVAVRPPAAADQKGLTIGDRLAPRAVVRTGPGGRVTLATRRGSEVTLNQNSQMAIVSAHSLHLRVGEVYCRSRAREVKQIATAAGTIELLGTTLDAALVDGERLAVTVLHGKVRLTNAHGGAVVEAGRKAVLTASLPPGAGAPADVRATTAWYDGRGAVLSDFGDIAYTVRRGDMLTEIWAMKADGSGKRHVKSYLGYGQAPGTWLPGEEWLLLDTHSLLWTTPDFTARRADAGAGHPIVENRAWLVNAATGEDAPFAWPVGYKPVYMTLSPDARRLAFSGHYQPDPKSGEGIEGGVFVFDLGTGRVTRVLEGWIKTAPAWAPDSKHLVVSAGEGYGTNYPLVVVDVNRSGVTDLKVQGAGASFSPEGTRVAYCGDFKGSGSWSMGVPTSGSIWVLSLAPGSKPVRISPEGQGALQPHWSPDGRRVAYEISLEVERKPGEERTAPGYVVYAAQADGSGVTEVYRKEPGPGRDYLQAVSWAPSGDAIYLSTSQGVLLVAADGSGKAVDLGGNEADSVLAPDEQQASDAAAHAVREAIFQYAVGQVRSFEGKPKESRAAYDAAAGICAGLPYDYPLAKLSLDDVLGYADKAAGLASRPVAEVLDRSCLERQSYLSILLMQYVGAKGAFPPDLAALEQYSAGGGWSINWVSGRDTDWVKMVFQCPAGGAYRYAPPPAGKDPEIGDVLITCPAHPANRLVWTAEMAGELGWQRASAAEEAVRKDPKLKALVEDAEWVRQQVCHTGTPSWDDVEKAYLAVLAAVPYEPTARENLGRMYTRWGQFAKAQSYLSPGGGRSEWSSLHYAFCLDALGQRDKALAIYAPLAKGDPEWAGTQWAKLGMEQPIWPHDLPIPAEAGEVRLVPDSHWHARATAAVIEGKPHLTGRPELAIDGDRVTSWQTYGGSAGQTPGEWFMLEFDTPQAVKRVVLDHYGERNFYTANWARGIKAEVSLEGTTWRDVDVTPAAILQPSTVRLDPSQPIKAIRFTTTAKHSPEWWAIYEVFVFGPAQQGASGSPVMGLTAVGSDTWRPT